jgi:hypothetical protein
LVTSAFAASSCHTLAVKKQFDRNNDRACVAIIGISLLNISSGVSPLR